MSLRIAVCLLSVKACVCMCPYCFRTRCEEDVQAQARAHLRGDYKDYGLISVAEKFWTSFGGVTGLLGKLAESGNTPED